jgi:catechol 2,3-dioxygenase-like lactoylglutathione lyase family enzyme
MRIEHLALNVADPVAMAAWYGEHLGLKIVRRIAEAPYTHFLADSTGTMLLEIYNNPPDQVPPYAEMDPLLLHVAFISENPAVDKAALLAAGATLVDDQHFDDGSHLVMLRDPWGLAIQLCKRGVPMLAPPELDGSPNQTGSAPLEK